MKTSNSSFAFRKNRESEGVLPYLRKDKKYRYRSNKENPLSNDIDHMIADLVPQKHGCTLKYAEQRRISLLKKVQVSEQATKSSQSYSHPLLTTEVKTLKL